MKQRPSPWVQTWSTRLPKGKVLDLACGEGRHALFFQALGHPVLAVDRRPPGQGDTHSSCPFPAGVVFELFDLEKDLVQTRAFLEDRGPFAGIVVTNYLYRPLLPLLPLLLRDGGILIYETFMRGQEGVGRPRNPEFLLKPGELLETFQGILEILGFEEGREGPRGEGAFKQKLCATRVLQDGCPPSTPLFNRGVP